MKSDGKKREDRHNNIVNGYGILTEKREEIETIHKTEKETRSFLYKKWMKLIKY